MAKLSDLLTSAAAVRNETAANQNTALRVGNVLYFLTQYLQQYTSVADISMKVSEVGVTITAKSQTSDTTLFDKTIALPVASNNQAGILTAEAFAAITADIDELQEAFSTIFNDKEEMASRINANSKNIANLSYSLQDSQRTIATLSSWIKEAKIDITENFKQIHDLSILMDETAEKADTAMRILTFAAIVENVNIEEQGVTPPFSILYDKGRGFFVANKNMKFYSAFVGSEDYNTISDGRMKARADRLFENLDDNLFYRHDGTALRQFVISDEERAKLFAYPANPLEIPTATTTKPGLMSASDKKKLDQSGTANEVIWTEQHDMNAYTECGEYHIHGERKKTGDHLPILNANPGHTIDATLTVLDSSLTNGTGAKTDTCVTQILRMSNRTGGDGHIFIRTGQAATKSQLAFGSSPYWGPWEKLMGIFETNGIMNVSVLDECTTNGMYSGLYANPNQASLGGINFYPGDTFIMITANGYAASPFGTPQLTQILFKFPVRKAPLPATANMYIRVAYWDTSDANNKRWVFGNFAKMVTAPELAALESRIAALEAKLS